MKKPSAKLAFFIALNGHSELAAAGSSPPPYPLPIVANSALLGTKETPRVPSFVSLPNCNGDTSALVHTGGKSFGCRAAINAATLGGIVTVPCNSVDDTAAIQAAITANYGKTLVLGSSCLISSGLMITKPISLKGLGGGRNNGTTFGTRIFTNTPGITLLTINETTGGGGDDSGGSISDILLDGNRKAAVGLSVIGIDTAKWNFFTFASVRNTHLGASLVSNHSLHFFGSDFNLNGSDGDTDGGVLLAGVQASVFIGTDAEANFGHGVLVSGGYDNLWSGGTIESNARDGIHGSGHAQGFKIDTVDMEENGLLTPATYYDINISASTVENWEIDGTLHTGTHVANSIYNSGTNTRVLNPNLVGSQKVLWTERANGGLFEGDVENDIDPRSILTTATILSIRSGNSGTGALVSAISPTLVTPVLGAAKATSIAVGEALPAGYALGIAGSVIATGSANFRAVYADALLDSAGHQKISWLKGAATPAIFSVDIETAGAAIGAPTSCGITPSAAPGSSDLSGEITEGTTNTGCVIPFSATKTHAPFCTVTSQMQLASFSYSISTSAITVTNSAGSGDKIDYVCVQH